jgi:hypothetical protein
MDLADPDGPFDPYANDGWPSQPHDIQPNAAPP